MKKALDPGSVPVTVTLLILLQRRLFHHKTVLQEAFLVEPKSQKEALVGEKGDNSEVPLTKVIMFFTSIFFFLCGIDITGSNFFLASYVHYHFYFICGFGSCFAKKYGQIFVEFVKSVKDFFCRKSPLLLKRIFRFLYRYFFQFFIRTPFVSLKPRP